MDFMEKLTSGYYENAGGFPYVSYREANNDPTKAAARKKFYEIQYQREDEFKADAFEELDITGNPKAELLFNKAYEAGHSNGYSEVWIQMTNFVDLIK